MGKIKQIKCILVTLSANETEKRPPIITVREMTVDSNNETFYKLLGCSLIDICRSRDFEIIVDDEGLYTNKYVTELEVKGEKLMPLAGSMLFVGPANRQGDLTDCTLSVMDITALNIFKTNL